MALRAARLGDPWEWLAVMDVEDDRSDTLPSNPTERAAARYPAPRPLLRHGSRIQRRRLKKLVSEQDVDW
jgi:hypothetical protein